MLARAARYRSEHRSAEYRRLKKKTKEEEFVDALHREFELSPKVSYGVLELVEGMFFAKHHPGDGQIRYTAVASEEGAGKTIDEMKKITVVITRDVPSDGEIREKYGDSAKRTVQILRMTEEAHDQGALLTQEDLGRILEVSSRTIRRDVVSVMKKGVRLFLRGLQRDIGKGVSHKIWIVGLYLQQKTYSEIERLTGHSSGAIKQYLNDFSRILMAKERGITSAREIGFYVGRSEHLVGEYLDLIARAHKDTQQRGRLDAIKSQMKHLERPIPLKKRDISMVWRLR
jgi:hypothetical protein